MDLEGFIHAATLHHSAQRLLAPQPQFPLHHRAAPTSSHQPQPQSSLCPSHQQPLDQHRVSSHPQQQAHPQMTHTEYHFLAHGDSNSSSASGASFGSSPSRPRRASACNKRRRVSDDSDDAVRSDEEQHDDGSDEDHEEEHRGTKRKTSTSGASPSEAKRLRRQQQNRDAAATSRNRKKAYLTQLEKKNAGLEAEVARLRAAAKDHARQMAQMSAQLDAALRSSSPSSPSDSSFHSSAPTSPMSEHHHSPLICPQIPMHVPVILDADFDAMQQQQLQADFLGAPLAPFHQVAPSLAPLSSPKLAPSPYDCVFTQAAEFISHLPQFSRLAPPSSSAATTAMSTHPHTSATSSSPLSSHVRDPAVIVNQQRCVMSSVQDEVVAKQRTVSTATAAAAMTAMATIAITLQMAWIMMVAVSTLTSSSTRTTSRIMVSSSSEHDHEDLTTSSSFDRSLTLARTQQQHRTQHPQPARTARTHACFAQPPRTPPLIACI